MQRTPQEEAEENAILEQAKVIESARRAEELANRAAAPVGAESPTAGSNLSDLISIFFAGMSSFQTMVTRNRT